MTTLTIPHMSYGKKREISDYYPEVGKKQTFTTIYVVQNNSMGGTMVEDRRFGGQ